MCRDLPGGQALGAYKLMTRVSKSVIPTLPLGHDHRLETAVPIPRNGNLHLAAIVGDHSRGPVPVARIGSVPARRIVLVVAQVVDQLLLQGGLDHRSWWGA